jgi:hypothetical protein
MFKKRLQKVVDTVLCLFAGLLFDLIQFFNQFRPRPSFTPKWSEKPLLKSADKSSRYCNPTTRLNSRVAA